MNPYFDDQPESQATHQQPDHGAPQQEHQSPLLLQEMQTPEEMFAIPRKSQRPRQLFVAVALLLGAVAAILAMRHFGMGPAVSLASVDMDYKPTTRDGALPRKVLAELERSRRAIQVPADQITQDPFELDSAPAADTGPRVDPDLERKAELERRRQAEAARQKAVDEAFAKLNLQGVMGGSEPMARINGRLYKVGMTVGDRFTVTNIQGRAVTLTAEGRPFTLTMTDRR